MIKVNLSGIKDRRTEMRITQQEMAETLGFKTASTYCKYENGEYNLEANHVPVIAKKLKMKIADLFFENIISNSAI